MNAHVNKSTTFHEASAEWGCITCTHSSRMLLVWYYDYTTVLSYVSLKSGCRTFLTTHVKSKQVGMYVQGIRNNKAQVKKGKIGLTRLRI